MSQSNNVCIRCKQGITPQDWRNYNVTNGQGGFQHTVCSINQNEISTQQNNTQLLYDKKYVSSKSQYTLNSTGSCTINALEAAIQLQIGSKPSIVLIDEILNLAALYQQDKHTAVMDIYPYISRYYLNLTKIEHIQISVKDIKQIIDKMSNLKMSQSAMDNHDKISISAILTKPPETIFLHFTETFELILFDSHPRKGLNGAHFLVFQNRFKMEKYLNILWPFQNLGKGFNDLFSQQINMLDVTLFSKMNGAKPNIKPNVNKIRNELNMISTHLENKWKKNYGASSSSSSSAAAAIHSNYNKNDKGYGGGVGYNEKKEYLDRISNLESELKREKQKNININSLNDGKLHSSEMEINRLKKQLSDINIQLQSAQIRIQELEKENKRLRGY